ncbi:hypothetical protein E2320_020836, partial [Naja naja]
MAAIKERRRKRCIKNITGGGGHSAVLTETGEIFFCGQNKDGQLGLGNGQIFSCGSNSFGQLGIPDISGRCTIPAMIKSSQDKIINIAAGLRHTVAVAENGSVFQWGIGMASQAKRMCQGKNIPSFLRAKEPCKVPGLENVKVRSVASGSHHVVSLTDDGDLYVWGNNKHKQLLSKDFVVLEPQKIEAHYFEGEKIRRIWSGWTHLVVQSETEKVFTWGRGDYGQLGRSEMPCEGQNQERKGSTEHHLKQSSYAPAIVSRLSDASEIACGSEHNLAIVGLGLTLLLGSLANLVALNCGRQQKEGGEITTRFSDSLKGRCPSMVPYKREYTFLPCLDYASADSPSSSSKPPPATGLRLPVSKQAEKMSECSKAGRDIPRLIRGSKVHISLECQNGSLSLDTFLDNKHCNMVINYAIHGVGMNVKDHERKN